jgi:hypothetical protein
MTMIVEVPRVSYVGDGVTDTFATGFTFELPSEVTVWRGEPTVEDCCEAPAYDNLLAQDVDYVWLPGDYLEDGGSIQVLPHAAIGVGEIITLMRTTPPDQPEDFGNDHNFLPEQQEYNFDRIVRMIQELYHNPLGFLLLGGLAYDWKHYVPDEWTDDKEVDVWLPVRTLNFAAGLVGARARVATHDADEKVISFVKQDDTVLATLTIPAGSGALSFATPGGAFQLGIGDTVRALPPEGGLGAVTGLAWMIPSSVG